MVIKDLKTLKKFFQERVKGPVFGAGVYAFHRLGPEEFLPDYRILALRYGLDTELIEKNIEIISLEKEMRTKHIGEPRNATTVLRNEKVYRYLSQYKKPVILVYKTSTKMERIANRNGWILAQAPVKFGKKLFENKVLFRKILTKLNIAVPPGEITTLNFSEDSWVKLTELYHEWRRAYGLPFVIQHPTRGGGKGTFFVNSEHDFWKARKKLKIKEGGEVEEETKKISIIVARFISGPSPSITGCVTHHGILSTNPQHQILDSPSLYSSKKGSGLFCGHDWSSSRFSKRVNKQAYEITKKVGMYLKSKGYKGIFGLDFVLDAGTQTLYVTECNPRFLGSSPTITMVQLANNEPPILAFHLLEYLNINYNIDLPAINKLMRKRKNGAQMLMHNLSGRWTRNHNQIRAGVYRLEFKNPKSKARNSKLVFVRPGYKLQHLKNKNEFLITEGVPFKKSHFSPNRRLVRIVTTRRVINNRGTLNGWAKNVAEVVYKSLDIKPVRFIRLRKLFNPHFLAKG